MTQSPFEGFKFQEPLGLDPISSRGTMSLVQEGSKVASNVSSQVC